MKSVKAERRTHGRKQIAEIVVSELTSLSNYNVIARAGTIVDASTSGFLLLINRQEIIPEDLRDGMTLESIVGHQVVMFLPQMSLDLDGTITRATHKGKGCFEVAVKFAPDVPEYWRDCLVDLLPEPGEMASD